jgi:hypothetical protein
VSTPSSFRGKNLKEDREKAYGGKLSPTAMKRLKGYVDLLVDQALPKTAINLKTGKPFTFLVSFVTLTLPASQGKITDAEIHKYSFKPFMMRMRRKFKLKTHIWRRERQKNGNIHYHLLTDVYIPHSDLREDWNACINRLGFVDRFYKKHGHRNPNSTDIHSVRKVKDLGKYIAKYMSKDTETAASVKGRLWDCSMNLKKAGKCTIIGTNDDYSHIIALEKFLALRKLDVPYCNYYPISREERKLILPETWFKAYEDYLERIRSG